VTTYELLIEVSGNRGGRPYVIVAVPAGHAWTPAELSEPTWRRVRVPLLAIEVDAMTDKAFRGVNVLALPPLAPGVVTDVTRARFLAAVTEK